VNPTAVLIVELYMLNLFLFGSTSIVGCVQDATLCTMYITSCLSIKYDCRGLIF
jgi:hypothetical protein